MTIKEFEAIPTTLHIAGDREQLGLGFQHLTQDFTTGSAFTEDSFKEAKAEKRLTSHDWSFKIDVIDSKQQLMTKLDLAASAEATLWGVNAQGSVAWVNDISFQEETVLVVVSAKKVTGITSYDSNKLQFTKEAGDMMAQNEFESFYNHFGSYFLGRVYRGGWLNLVFRKDFSTREEKRTASAKLKASGTGWRGDAKAAHSASSLLDKYQLHVQGHAVGGVTPHVDGWTAEKAIQWAMNTWLYSLDDQNAGPLELEMESTWTGREGNPRYQDFLSKPQQNYEALTDYMLQLEQFAEQAAYLKADPEKCQPKPQQVTELNELISTIEKDQNRLREHFATADGLGLKSPQDVLGHNKADDLSKIEKELNTLQTKLELRRPLTMNDQFRLSTTGKAGIFYLAGPRNNMGPSMDKSSAQAEPLHCDGQDPRVGAEVRLHSIRGLDDKHIITAMGRNTWLEYQKGAGPENTWKIEAKAAGVDEYIRHGDFIQLTNNEYPDMTIKAGESDGRYWAKTQSYRHYWLHIERFDAPLSLEHAPDDSDE
ncbi:MAG: hypothetical protein NPIRA04_28330 [Nitrospirales bacterium]|nr:MAG: hypothetical protein NPIRA04_28330 [Nitrospirales bacterium]